MKRIFSLAFLILILSLPGFSQQQQDERTNFDSVSHFDRITETPFIVRRSVPDTSYKQMLQDEAYWYVNYTPPKKEKKTTLDQRNNIFFKPWFRTLLWMIIVAGFMIVIAWYLASSNIKLFRRSSSPIHKDEKRDEAEDIFHLHYNEEISKAIEDKNYRMAVRFLYLQTLKILSEAGKIDYRQGKTNAEYLQQLYNTVYYTDFFRLTRDFEYTWYGQFNLSEQGYEMMRKEFFTFKGKLRK
jgi:hypothetical protein